MPLPGASFFEEPSPSETLSPGSRAHAEQATVAGAFLGHDHIFGNRSPRACTISEAALVIAGAQVTSG